VETGDEEVRRKRASRSPVNAATLDNGLSDQNARFPAVIGICQHL
jgi:hypothetical protein